MTVFKITMATAMLAALAACGGGSTGEGGGGGGGGGGASFNDLVTEFESLADGIGFVEGGENDPADFADLPDSGTAEYNGVLALVVGDQASLGTTEDDFEGDSVDSADALGEVALSVNFGASTISGSATNFIDSFDQAVDGTLTMAEGTIENVAGIGLFGGDVTGTLTNSDGESFTTDDAGYLGNFSPDAGTAYGLVGGNLITDVEGVDGFLGVFVAAD